MSYGIESSLDNLLQGLGRRTLEIFASTSQSPYNRSQTPAEHATFRRTLEREFSEMQTKALEVLARHGHGESTNPYGVAQVKKLIADQQMLFLGHCPTISKYTEQVWRLLEGSVDVGRNVSFWELPRMSTEILMLATSSNVIGKLLGTRNISKSSLREIDHEIELNLQRLNGAITSGLHGSSFQMDRIYPILFSLCENFGDRAMSHIAMTTGLERFKTQLQSHRLSPGGPLGAFSTAYVAYVGDKAHTTVRDSSCFSDSLQALFEHCNPYKTFYTSAQRTSSREVGI